MAAHARLVAAVAAVAVLACQEAVDPGADSGSVALTIVGSVTRSLESGRVTVEGPTDKSVEVTPGSSATITGLAPGTYTVTLEGLIGGEVDHFGRTGGVQVVAGQNTPVQVTFASFVPVVDPLPGSGTGALPSVRNCRRPAGDRRNRTPGSSSRTCPCGGSGIGTSGSLLSGTDAEFFGIPLHSKGANAA